MNTNDPYQLFQSDLDQAQAAEQRYLDKSDRTALDESIAAWERILQHPEFANVALDFRLGVWNDSAVTYWRRYQAGGNLNDLERALSGWQRLREQLSENSPYLPTILTNLGNGWRCRYQRTGAVGDLDAGIECFQQAVSLTPADAPDLPRILTSLGAGLIFRYQRTGVIGDLDAGIECFQQAVSLTPSDAPDQAMFLTSLGIGLTDRYQRTGAVGDLDAGIQCYQQAVALTPTDATDRAMFLTNLGTGLRDRYQRTGAVGDLDAGIQRFQQAVVLTPADAPNKAMFLTNLGNGLRDRYQRTGVVGDLDAGIECFQQAVALTPTDAPNKAMYLNNLGTGLTDRYQRTGAMGDLDVGIECFQQAVALTPTDAPNKAMYLNNLGTGLTDRYQRTGAMGDLDVGIECFQQAVALTPTDAPNLPGHLVNLGNGLKDRYQRTGAVVDLDAGIQCFQQAAQRGLEMAMEVTLGSASNWLHWAFTRQSWPEVTEAHSYAYEAGQHLLKVQLFRAHKESWLKEMQGLASQSAYAFTKLNQLKEAVVALERGLARLLSEALQRDRANLEQLKTTGYTDLYNRYQDIVDRYHWAQLQQVDALKTAQADLDKTIEDIRQVPGYEDFLTPVEFELIQAAAQETPLVYILTTSAGGLALIVKKEEITPVWLPNLEDTFAGYWEAYIQWRNNPTDQNLRHHWHTTIETTTQQLWTAVMQPVINALPPDTHHLTLIPVGRLNLLPWHAAWTEDDATGRCYALDKLTIAYAPNAVTVTQCQPWAKLTTVPKLLAISEPHPQPPTAGSLHYSRYATPAICSLFPDNTQQLARTQATVAAVTAQLREAHTLWYFYCHGLTNFEEPLKSGLLLAGSQEQFLTLGDVLNLKVTGVRLATLAACETNIPNLNKLPDEVVSLAAGLLQAGVAGVIASLWSVDAVSTAFLMVRCYDILQQRWQTDGNMQAPLVFALQEAQRWLRDSTKRELQEWIDQRQLRQHLDAVLKKELDRLWRNEAEEYRPFASPYYWAAFVAMGV